MSGPLVIVGDCLLDVDIEGSASRLSPEAPVPVVDAERNWQRPGGAGLAAVLAARTEDDVVLLTALADDAGGRRLRELLGSAGVRVLTLPMTGATLTKTRIRARGQSMLRVDTGDARPAPRPFPVEAAGLLEDARAVLVADYGGGITALAPLRAALTVAARRVPVVWDPHPRGSVPVPGCAMVTPNEAEAQHFCTSDGERLSCGELRHRWAVRALCVTLGTRGARVHLASTSACHIGVPEFTGSAPTRADVCGAGDRFAVAVTVELGAGADPLAAVAVAVTAAARFVTAGGAAAVATPAPSHTRETGWNAVQSDDPEDTDVLALIRRLRALGRTVVATGGCFDLLHTGHIRLLRQARQLGDALVVVLNSDDSVRRLKGPGRPVVTAADRARVLAALACVDAVTVFDEATPERLLDRLRPDIWVKGGDYTVDDLPEAGVVRRHGGEVVILPTVAGYSSSSLIAAARSVRALPERP